MGLLTKRGIFGNGGDAEKGGRGVTSQDCERARCERARYEQASASRDGSNSQNSGQADERWVEKGAWAKSVTATRNDEDALR